MSEKDPPRRRPPRPKKGSLGGGKRVNPVADGVEHTEPVSPHTERPWTSDQDDPADGAISPKEGPEPSPAPGPEPSPAPSPDPGAGPEPGRQPIVPDSPTAVAMVARTLPDSEAEPASGSKLTAQQWADRDKCEKVLTVAQGMSWLRGSALRIMYKRELWRETHDSFEAYANEIWEFSRQYAYLLIAMAPLAERMVARTDRLSERQVRALHPYAERHGLDAADLVFATVVDTESGRVSGALLDTIVKQLPSDRFEESEVRTLITEYLRGPRALAAPETKKPAEPETVAVFATGQRRLHKIVRSVVKVAPQDPALARQFAAELRAAADELEGTAR